MKTKQSNLVQRKAPRSPKELLLAEEARTETLVPERGRRKVR